MIAMTEQASTTTPTEAATEAFEKVVVTDSSEEDAAEQKSALQDNIERMGKNAYYFAHAHKANGPKWDGKVEPKLLSSRSISSEDATTFKKTSFDVHKSNITSYAFSDEGKNVKLYLTMEDVGEKCSDEDISLEWTEDTLCLVVNNYMEEPQCLSFGKLTATITKATCRKKKDRLVLTLTKENEGEWQTINDKGTGDI
jgi:hypothetical protein